MAQIKGVLLNAWMTFLKLRYGDQAVAFALDLVNPDERGILSFPFMASSWYSYDMVSLMQKVTRQLTTREERTLAFEIGGFMAQHAFTGIYHSLLAADPLKQIEKAPWMEGFFFSGAWSVETEILEPSSCAIKCTYEKDVTPARSFCESVKGFWVAMIELSGGRDVSAEHTACVLNDSDSCDFRFDWRVD